MKRIAIALCLIAPLLGAQPRVINLTFDHWSNSRLTGPADLVAASLQEQIPFQYVNFPLSIGLQLLKAGQADCLMFSDSLFFERYTQLEAYSSSAIQTSGWVFAALSPNHQINQLNDLMGKRVAVVKGLRPDLIFSVQLKDNLTVVQENSEKMLVEALMADQVEVAMLSVGGLHKWAAMAKAPLYYQPELILFKGAHHINCRQNADNERFIRQIDEQLIELRQSGVLERILLSPTLE